jgi:DNA mismatch repair protein PMS2
MYTSGNDPSSTFRCLNVLIPVRARILELTASDEVVAMENIDVLKLNGFELSVTENAAVGERLRLVAQPQSKDTVFDMKGIKKGS